MRRRKRLKRDTYLRRTTTLGRRTKLRRTQPLRPTASKRDWTRPRLKLEREGRCRVCGRRMRLDPAHIIARARAAPGHGEHEDNVVPLCRPCHRAYDERRRDLLTYLTVAEQAKAVELAGGIISALRRLTGSR